MLKITKIYLIITVLSILLLQTACKILVTEQPPTSKIVHNLYIDSNAPYNYLSIQMQQAFVTPYFKIVKNKQLADFSLKLFHEHFSTKVVTESASSATKKYALLYEVEFQLQTPDDKIIYGPKTIRASRNMFVSEDQVLSSTNETGYLHKKIQHDAMLQMLHQLTSTEVQQALNQT